MLNRIFDPGNAVWRGVSKLFDTVVLGMLWLVLCLPVFTAGAATAALYYTAVKCIRRGEDGVYRNFFQSFRQNFRTGVPVSLLFAGAGVLLAWGYRLILALANAQGGGMAAMYYAFLLALVLPLGALCYAFPLLSRFTFRPVGLISMSVKLSMAHLPTTVLLVLLLVEAVQLCQRYWYLYFLPLFVCPGVLALVYSVFLERIFKPLTPDEAAEDGDKPWYLK